jgi:hypothetical protein
VTAGERQRDRTGPPIGRVRCPDGVERDVFQDAEGRQYVIGDQGERTFGPWLPAAPSPAGGITAEPEPFVARLADKPLEDEEDEAPWEESGVLRRDCESHRGRLLSHLGTISFGCGVISMFFAPMSVVGLGLGLWTRLAARRDLRKMNEGTMDMAGLGRTQGALSDGTLGAVLSGIGLLLGTAVTVTLLFLYF